MNYLIGRRRLDEAWDKLIQLNQRYPDRPEVLIELVDLCYERQDMRSYLRYSHQLFKHESNDPDLLYGVTGAYMINGYLALALQMYRRAVAKYPDHEYADRAREVMPKLEAGMTQVLADLEFTEPDALALAAEHDQIRLELHHAARSPRFSLLAGPSQLAQSQGQKNALA